jgi:hypothetical protein
VTRPISAGCGEPSYRQRARALACRLAGLIWTTRTTVSSFGPLLSRVAPSAPVTIEHHARLDRLPDVKPPEPVRVQAVYALTLESIERHDSL